MLGSGGQAALPLPVLKVAGQLRGAQADAAEDKDAEQACAAGETAARAGIKVR